MLYKDRVSEKNHTKHILPCLGILPHEIYRKRTPLSLKVCPHSFKIHIATF